MQAHTRITTHGSRRHSRSARHRPALWKCSSGGRGRPGAGPGKGVPAHTLPHAPGGIRESSGTAARQGWAGRAGHSPHCSLHSHWCLPKQCWLAWPPQGTAESHRCPGLGQSQTHLPVRTGCKSSWLPTPAPSGTTSSQPAPAGCARSCWSLETHGVSTAPPSPTGVPEMGGGGMGRKNEKEIYLSWLHHAQSQQ